ncbi:MAG TPA: hypothetical protein VG097_13495, partial [Gemmata sp.]|nr:hypothetical protein [Gemmata sp.]
MAAIVPEMGSSNAVVAAKIALPAIIVGKFVKREALMQTTRLFGFMALSFLLVFNLVNASPQAPPSDTKGTPKSAPTTEKKTDIAIPEAVNPRGEPLTFDTNSTEISLAGPTWWSVAVSPEGKQIATAQGNGNKGEVKIWDVETGKIARVISEAKGVRSVAYSPDGTILVAGCYGGKLRFYKTTDYKLCAEGKDGNVPVINGICFFKNGKYLATADQDKFTRIWDVGVLFAKEKPKEKPGADPITISTVAILEGHTQAVLALSVSTDGKTILTGGQDRTARCYDVPDRLPAPGAPPIRVKKERLLLDGHNSAVAAVAISPDGKLFASGDWSALVLIRSKDGKQTDSSFRLQSSVRSLEFNSDGKYLVAGAGNINPIDAPGEVRVWDVVGKKEVANRSDYPLVVRAATFTPDSKTIVSVGPDQALTLWPYAGKDRKRLASATINFTPQPLQAAAISPDGSLLAFSGETPSVFIFNRTEERLVAELKGHEDVVPGLAFSPDGKTLATASYDKTIKLWNTETWKEPRTLTGHKSWVFSVAFSPDGKTLVSGSYDKTLRIWNVQSGESKMQLNDHTAGIRSVAFSTDGKKLVSGGSDRVVRIWDSAEGKVLFALKGHKKAVRAVAFSPDGNSVVSGSEDQMVKLWDATTGKESISFPEFPEMVTALSFSPKGQTIAAGTFQGAIALLDPITGRTRQTLRVHNESVSTLLFADNGQHIISVAQDRSMRQWSVLKTPIVAPAETIVSKVGAITSVAGTSDGRFVALGSSNGSINLWDMSKGTQFPCPVHHTIGIAHIAIVEGIPSGIRIASIDKDGSLLVSSQVGKDPWKGKGTFATFTPDGKFLAVAEGKEIILRESATGKEARRFVGGHDGDVIRLDFSPDGKLLASVGQDTKVRLWNAASGEKLQATPAFGNESAIKHLSFSPDGNRFAVSAYGPDQPSPDDMTGNFRPVKDVRVYAVPKAGAAFASPIMFAPQPTDQPITAILWDRNGQLLIMPASDGTVRYNDFVNGSRET